METLHANSRLNRIEKPSLRTFGEYVGAVALCNGVGLASQAISGGSDTEWYRNLEKPSFNPPGAVFGIVWTVLYTLMGLSLGRLLGERGSPRADRATQLFTLQLVLNGLWSVIFFRWKSPGWALVEITFLLAAIGMTIRAAWRVSPVAGALLIPYLLWVGFATILNGSIWWLNR